MEVTLIKENADGSASYQFDMTDPERCSLLSLGIITALERGIKEGMKYDDNESSEASVGDTGCGTVSCSYGPCVKSGKPEQPCICSETAEVPYWQQALVSFWDGECLYGDWNYSWYSSSDLTSP